MPQAAAAPVPVVHSPTLTKFRDLCAQAAQQLGIRHLVVAARDPVSGETHFFATMGAKEELRGVVAEKCGLSDVGETAWPSD